MSAFIAVKNLNLVPMGHQQLTSLSSATGLTVPAGATRAQLQCETQNVRWRDDGTDPTAAVGMILVTTTVYEYIGNLSAIKFIQVASSAKLNVAYYR